MCLKHRPSDIEDLSHKDKKYLPNDLRTRTIDHWDGHAGVLAEGVSWEGEADVDDVWFGGCGQGES